MCLLEFRVNVVILNSGMFRASNVSHTVVLRPLKAGYFNFTSASVSYLAQEGGKVVVSFIQLNVGMELVIFY